MDNAPEPRLGRLALRGYPSHLRTRYGNELLVLLAASPNPRRDLLDIVRCGLRERMEILAMTYLRPLAAILAAIGLFALGYTLNDLQDGLAELPMHWWSSAPVALLVLAALLWFAPAARRRRPPAAK